MRHGSRPDAGRSAMVRGALVAVLLAGGAVGCAGDGEADTADRPPRPTTPAAAVNRAAEESESITSLRYEVRGTVSGRGRLEAEATMTTQPSTLSMTQTGEAYRGLRLETRFVDGAMYASGSMLRSDKLVGRKKWVTAAPAVWGGGAIENQSYLMVPRQLEGSPLVQSTLLTGSRDVKLIGTDKVRGKDAPHYRGTVTYDGLTASLKTGKTGKTGKSGGAGTRRFDHFLNLEVADPLTMDLWLDPDGRPLQFRMRAAYDKKNAGQDLGPLDLTVTFLEIDPRTSIKAPPPDTVIPLKDSARRD
ncbi:MULTISPECIES: hypothetical protein [unclassified Streptomyces]|uniref:hypothetical protein n=1 Tax=unclassified Streptomyces TaxID=2593676 RepID=UPI0037F98E6F